jgi:hypothetical protein
MLEKEFTVDISMDPIENDIQKFKEKHEEDQENSKW